MMWATWRQHRAELLCTVALLILAAVPIVWTGIALHHAYRADGVAVCVAEPSRAGCGSVVGLFMDRNGEWGNRFVWVSFLPALVGVFVGAPLLAREFEYGTWRLAFTQSITRTRWIVTKLATVAAGAAVIALGLALLLSWWRAPLDAIGGQMRTAAFVVAPASLVSVTLFAFALGVFVGSVLRRTIASMGVTLVAYLAVRITAEEYARPHYQTPLVRITDPATVPSNEWHPSTDWIIDDGWIDSAGRHLTDRAQSTIVQTAQNSGTPLERYLAEHGLRHYTEYHPGSRFAVMQLIESAMFLGLAGMLIAATIWIVRRRTS